MTLILSCFSVVVLQKLFNLRFFSFTVTLLIQHIYQFLWLSVCVSWVFIRDWPWVQSGFFVMHSITMLMKQHSYLAVNREMGIKLQRWTILYGMEQRTKEEDEELVELERDLQNGKTRFPNNVTFGNFLDFLVVPTLVYELEYPRTPSFRPIYFLEKVCALFGMHLKFNMFIQKIFLKRCIFFALFNYGTSYFAGFA